MMKFFKPVCAEITLWERLNEDRIALREKMRLETPAKAIESLKSYFSNKKVDKVFLTGSILREGFFYDFSDIDVVVEGLKESYRIMDEVRGFRQIFRHSYDYELSPKKTEDLKELLLAGREAIDCDLMTFEEFLERILF